jgi:hypothetical protein
MDLRRLVKISLIVAWHCCRLESGFRVTSPVRHCSCRARDGKPASFWGLKGSASVHGKALMLTVVNPGVSEIRETEITVRGASIKSGTTTVLTNSDLHAHNSFDQRNEVTPQVKDLQSTGRVLTIHIPPRSRHKGGAKSYVRASAHSIEVESKKAARYESSQHVANTNSIVDSVKSNSTVLSSL